MGEIDLACRRCLMDSSVGDLSFDSQGNCNYCREYLILQENMRNEMTPVEDLHNQLKKKNNSGYDCLMGISGGIDSAWALYLAVNNGLKPLVVHMDNGWNSELAQNNIEKLVKGLGVELYTHVIRWEEYRELMKAFFSADVIDVELLYDNAMLAVNWSQASKIGAKYILAGTNTATEGLRMPSDWAWFKYDKRNIRSIWNEYSNKKFPASFPAIGTFEYIYYSYMKGISWVNYLDYFNYNKTESEDILSRELGFKPYPYKHYESIFTRFYQGYILPEKFFVDKRKVHLSTLVVSGQLTREQALLKMKEGTYHSHEELESDKHYFLKKMKWAESDLDEYIQRSAKPHLSFSSEKGRWDKLASLYRRHLRSA